MSPEFITIVIFLSFFALGQSGHLDRRLAMVTGACVMMFMGWALDFYLFAAVLQSIWYETLALIFGMSMISATLARAGLFDRWADKLTEYTGGDAWSITVLMVLVTYATSLFINNLSAMVVLIPVTLTLCQRLKINPLPVIIVEVIASNLGGASTMMGDFPNMIITSAGDLHFLDFTGSMMPLCLVLLAVLLGFLSWKNGKRELFSDSSNHAGHKVKLNTDGSSELDPYLYRLGISVLALTIAGFLLAEVVGIRPGGVALAAGLFLLVSGNFDRDEFLRVGGLGDMSYFLGLFIMVGGLSAAGVLEGVVEFISTVSSDSDTVALLALMWIAYLMTPFLNAGPATALFIPVAISVNAWIPGDVVWWALSLGILAGSSAALTGATSGPVAVTIMENFQGQQREQKDKSHINTELNFQSYLQWGLPISLLFLTISSLYIVVIAN